MALFGLIDTTELEQFAAGLADDFLRRFPPQSEKRTDPGVKHQFQVIIDGLCARAVRYRDEHGLGIYKKAKLGNVFRWRLQEHGYSKDLVERATQQLVTRVAGK